MASILRGRMINLTGLLLPLNHRIYRGVLQVSKQYTGCFIKELDNEYLTIEYIEAVLNKQVSKQNRGVCQKVCYGFPLSTVIYPAVGCHYFPPGMQLPLQPVRGLLPILLLGEQKQDGCEQFACVCLRLYPTASGLRFEPRPCSAPDSSTLTTRLPRQPSVLIFLNKRSYRHLCILALCPARRRISLCN